MLLSRQSLQKKMQLKQKNHEKFLENVLQRSTPEPDKKIQVMIKGVRRVQSSSVAALGNTDSYGMGLEAKEWLKKTDDIEHAEDVFWTKSAPSKSARMWNDPSISDSLFAADEEIKKEKKSTRQNIHLS